MAVIPYTPRVDPKERGLMVSLWGPPKSGRTHLAFTFPEPIRSLCFDARWQEARDAFADKDIQVVDIDPAESWEMKQQWLQGFHDTYKAMIAECAPLGGTVVVDSATDLWTLVYEVERGQIQRDRWQAKRKSDPQLPLNAVELMQFDWGTSNTHMANLIRLGKLHPRLNIVLIHKEKDEYRGPNPTGRTVIACHSQTPSAVHGTFHISMPEREKDDLERELRPKLRVDECGANVGYTGLVFENPNYELIRGLLGRGKD